MANPNLDDNILNQPIAIADAANMLRHQIKKNEKVFDATLMKLNNQLVDRWYEEVLIKLASKGGCVACGRFGVLVVLSRGGPHGRVRQEHRQAPANLR